MSKERYRNDREKHAEAQRWRSIKHTYGLTKTDWMAMYEAQDGRCKICRVDLPITARLQGQMRSAACVDHDSVTGRVRGLLCHDCNLGIGRLKHDVAILSAAIDYLKTE